MIINKTRQFKKSFVKLNDKIQEKFFKRIENFKINPFSPELRNHKLKWEFNWYRSINITWDYRAIFRELSDWSYEFIEFVDIWTHSFLY